VPDSFLHLKNLDADKERLTMADDATYLTLTADNFEAEVMQSDVPVLVDFWAAWCGPCRIMNPIVEELAETFAGRAKVAKLNVDEEDALALQYHVMAIPTLIFFQNGERVDTVEGVVAKDDLVARLEALVTANSAV
jgi:thioredoxin 1